MIGASPRLRGKVICESSLWRKTDNNPVPPWVGIARVSLHEWRIKSPWPMRLPEISENFVEGEQKNSRKNRHQDSHQGVEYTAGQVHLGGCATLIVLVHASNYVT
jgi:hypothetical protein